MKGKVKKSIAIFMVLAMIFNVSIAAYAEVDFLSNLNETREVDPGGPEDGELQQTIDEIVSEELESTVNGDVYGQPQQPIVKQVYEILYLLNETDEPVPGLDTVTGFGDVGTTVEIQHPAINGYQVLADQPSSLVIDKDEELNRVVIYYEQIPKVIESTILTINHTLILGNGEELVHIETIEDLNVGDVIIGSDYAINEDGVLFTKSVPTELTLITEDNMMDIVYELEYEGEEIKLLPSESPDFLDGEGEELGGAPYIEIPTTSAASASKMSRMMKSSYVNSIKHPGNINTIEWPKPGALYLAKEAELVEGTTNQWELTLTMQGKNIANTSDIVLVIDRSGSMENNQRLDDAKAVARSFVNNILVEGDTANRIAIVSFASDVEVESNFTANKQALLSAIDNIKSSGGTFIQAGLKQARELLNSSAADSKNIVLLGDGEATYSYFGNLDFSNIRVRKFFIWKWLEGTAVSKSYLTGHPFDYDEPVGNGQYSNATGEIEYTLDGVTDDIDYNIYHSDNTIAEAQIAKEANQIIYTIALDAGDDGEETLEEVASPGKAYTGSNDDLQKIFQTIAGDISYAATDVTVTDPMGDEFSIPGITADNYNDLISVNQGSVAYDMVTETITWILPSISEGNACKMTYIVQIDDDVELGVLYPTNKDTFLDYININGDIAKTYFPIPEVGIERTEYDYTVKYFVNQIEQTLWEAQGAVPVSNPIVSSVPDKSPIGYKVDEEASTELPYTVTEEGNVIEVYYVVDQEQTLDYTVNYYKDGAVEPFATSSGEVLVANPVVESISYENMPIGYKVDEANSTELPYTVTEEGNVIEVYYVVDQEQTLDYTVNYYKDGAVEPFAT
ncbi:vWA domain-containing protein, partial [Brassicibacter mesophilus]|uniref:vWA domain-containing protein n=1 Tax=Brassicibacter mesophilus TaxID=745119 RepID=UPI003D2345A0